MSTTTMDTDDVLGRSRTHALEHPTPFQRLVATDGIAPTIARLGLGLVILPHALQKAFGMFGGHGLAGTYDSFTQMMPGPIAFLAIAAEIFGVLSLVFGFLTRLGAIAIAAVMLGATFLVHLPNGFFMDWEGTMQGEGYEFHLLALTLCLVALIKGGGLFSVDRLLMHREPTREGKMNPAFAKVTQG